MNIIRAHYSPPETFLFHDHLTLSPFAFMRGSVFFLSGTPACWFRMDGIIADSRKRRFDARHKGQHEKNNPLFKRYLVIALLLLVTTAHPARAQLNQTTNLVAQGKTGLQAQSAGEDNKAADVTWS